MCPVLYLPNEPEHFLGFFTSWIRMRIQEAYFYADPCGSGSETLPVAYWYASNKNIVSVTVFNFIYPIYFQ